MYISAKPYHPTASRVTFASSKPDYDFKPVFDGAKSLVAKKDNQVTIKVAEGESFLWRNASTDFRIQWKENQLVVTANYVRGMGEYFEFTDGLLTNANTGSYKTYDEYRQKHDRQAPIIEKLEETTSV